MATTSSDSSARARPGAALPSFTLVIETENLVNADIEGLGVSLASLQAQDVPPQQASEVLIINSGDLSADFITRLTAKYPWLKVITAPASTTYYQAKMFGAGQATGSVVVYCDSDCEYAPGWLRGMLAPFAERRDVDVVAGETTTRGDGIYGTAMALTYIFPQHSDDGQLTQTPHYFLNNVAFRRSFLLSNPIPTDLPLYRGNCVVHAHSLRRHGHTIWRQPRSKAVHAAPNGFSHFFWRFLLIGHDFRLQQQYLSRIENDPKSGGAQETIMGRRSKAQVFFDRIGGMLRGGPKRAVQLIVALPVVVFSIVLIGVGYVATIFRPNLMVEAYEQVLQRQQRQA